MTDQQAVEARPLTGAGSPASQEVSWWATHQFITALVNQANTTLPWAGTPAWRALDDGDPRKLLALALAGEHHVLRIEIGQEAIEDAGQQISAAEDWSVVAQQVQRRREIDSLRRTA
ncbi:DUF2742 domain-containing protein [Mycolicibacterium obuense]|uniref:DUF2742 domain-containing protein n=1 Tax=Mycolicibacterium obuense TaxID=1807 RepID=A0A0M2JXA8_9MYCO|nr:DUF2742 domain-containing protein [Mycolicibacterium obuense]KKE99468.1 hypothetical protein WN67_23815 [Mycolicibacterium obuense]